MSIIWLGALLQRTRRSDAKYARPCVGQTLSLVFAGSPCASMSRGWILLSVSRSSVRRTFFSPILDWLVALDGRLRKAMFPSRLSAARPQASGSGSGSGGRVCQKCLQPGHATYECKSTSRPYVSRPTRTQLLADPRLKRREEEKRRELGKVPDDIRKCVIRSIHCNTDRFWNLSALVL